MTTQRSVVLPPLAFELLDNGLRPPARCDRRSAAPQRLTERHDIRAALAALKREPSPRPPRAGYHFVGDPDRTSLAGAQRWRGVIFGVVVDAALRIVDGGCRSVRQGACGLGEILVRRRIVRRRAIDRAIGRGQNADRCHRGRQLRATGMYREAAMPLRLHGHAAGQADKAVIGTFAGGERRALRQCLAKRECHIIRLASADAKADGTDPVLFALEGDPDQIVGGLLAPDPGPALVHDGRIRGATDRFHPPRMTMAKPAPRITSVYQSSAIFEEITPPLPAYHIQR